MFENLLALRDNNTAALAECKVKFSARVVVGSGDTLSLRTGPAAPKTSREGTSDSLTYIGRFLDDIVVCSDGLDGHVGRVRLVRDIHRRKELYLHQNKLHLMPPSCDLLYWLVRIPG